MVDESGEAVTALLLNWRKGDKGALDRLVPLVYDELRRVARARLRAERAHSVQTTALVHEAYIRLVDLDRMTIHSRTHFFTVAVRLMREILVDHARRRLAGKRGGDVTIVALDEVSPAAKTSTVDLLALDQALDHLRMVDGRLCRVVDLRFFAGLNIHETAEALELSTATVERDWPVAKAWLHARLSI